MHRSRTQGSKLFPEQKAVLEEGVRSQRHRAGTDVSKTYHSAVGHGALGSAGALGALPPLWLSVRRLADLEDIPGGSGAVFAPIRCRTHAYTSTNKTALTRNASLPCTPPQNSATFPLASCPADLRLYHCLPYSLPPPTTAAAATAAASTAATTSSVYAQIHLRQLLAALKADFPRFLRLSLPGSSPLVSRTERM